MYFKLNHDTFLTNLLLIKENFIKSIMFNRTREDIFDLENRISFRIERLKDDESITLESVKTKFDQNEKNSPVMSEHDGFGCDSPDVVPLNDFCDAKIRKELLNNVAECGYYRPTPVQRYSIPAFATGRDLLVTAQTGSGKTAAFMLPIISAIMNTERILLPSALVIAPTRELAKQIFNETRKFCKQCQVRSVCLCGGDNTRKQLNSICYGIDIIIATPGRLVDILDRQFFSSLFRKIKFFVLDEADRMLDMGFEEQLKKIANEARMPGKDKRQTLLFSATFAPDTERIAKIFVNDNKIRIHGKQETPGTIDQEFIAVPEDDKLRKLVEYIKAMDGSILIFVEMKRSVDQVAESLMKYVDGDVVTMHGDLDQRLRDKSLGMFRSGKAKIMIATDVMSRGIDAAVDLVINYDLPSDLATYKHRIGRTGRAGKDGKAITLYDGVKRNTPLLQQIYNSARKEGNTVRGLDSIINYNGRR